MSETVGMIRKNLNVQLKHMFLGDKLTSSEWDIVYVNDDIGEPVYIIERSGEEVFRRKRSDTVLEQMMNRRIYVTFTYIENGALDRLDPIVDVDLLGYLPASDYRSNSSRLTGVSETFDMLGLSSKRYQMILQDNQTNWLVSDS